jgi:hypothetical protein
VEFSEEAAFVRDERTTLAAFHIDDEVVAEGRVAGRGFAGTALISVYQPLSARIVGKSGDRLQTTKGLVRIPAHVQRQEGERLQPISVDDYVVGEELVALARSDPQSGELVAVRVYSSALHAMAMRPS